MRCRWLMFCHQSLLSDYGCKPLSRLFPYSSFTVYSMISLWTAYMYDSHCIHIHALFTILSTLSPYTSRSCCKVCKINHTFHRFATSALCQFIARSLQPVVLTICQSQILLRPSIFRSSCAIQSHAWQLTRTSNPLVDRRYPALTLRAFVTEQTLI